MLLCGHILAVTVAPMGSTGAFYSWLSPHSQAEGRAVEIWTKNGGFKGLWVPEGLLSHCLLHNHLERTYGIFGRRGGWNRHKEEASDSAVYSSFINTQVYAISKSWPESTEEIKQADYKDTLY